MKYRLPLLFAASLIVALPAAATDCGEPPFDAPAVPDGSTASSEDIRITRDAVVDYSKKVDEYLTCMDQRAQVILPYLSKEQKERWDEDLTKLHETRRDVQIKMNEAIRAYRRSQG